MSDRGDMKQNKTRGYFFPQGVCNPAGRKNTELTKSPHPTTTGAKKEEEMSYKQHVKEAKKKKQTIIPSTYEKNYYFEMLLYFSGNSIQMCDPTDVVRRGWLANKFILSY